jgi:general stress protein 26
MQQKTTELLSTGKYAVLTTMMPNGAPNSHMMWAGCDEDGNVLINTEVHRRKFKNMTVGAKATVLVFENNFSWCEVRGTVVQHVGGAAARAHIDTLAQMYTGADYANPVQTERVIVKIKPDYELVFPPG